MLIYPLGVMGARCAVRKQTIMAHYILSELREEARMERALARFEPDDDLPNAPEADPLASAQSRRAAKQ